MGAKPREDETLFEEPHSADHKAGRSVITAHATPYDRYMVGGGIPTYRDIGFPDVCRSYRLLRGLAPVERERSSSVWGPKERRGCTSSRSRRGAPST